MNVCDFFPPPPSVTNCELKARVYAILRSIVGDEQKVIFSALLGMHRLSSDDAGRVWVKVNKWILLRIELHEVAVFSKPQIPSHAF